MNMTNLIPYRWRVKHQAGRHHQAIAAVLDTPPLVPQRGGLVLFSMIGTAVVLPYLVAVKSLWQQLGRGRVAILDDGTLTAQDRAVLATHLGDPQILKIDDVPRGDFPKGGCWERLLTILDHRAGEYWLQLDSDTVTLGPVPELERAIGTNRSFTMLGGDDVPAEPLDLAEFARRYYPDGPTDGHVQCRVESRMATLAAPGAGWKYIRGCAGFAGFAAGNAGRDLAGAFLRRMAGVIGGDDTAIWGTEQIASNFLVANEPGAVCLPHDRYRNYWGEPCDEAAFIHFVGAHRYDHGAYQAASLQAIAALQK